MTSANEIQHGGSHYKGAKIQHWDFVVDHKIGYLEGCGTKYLSRHPQKNGLEDVLKAEHYTQKTLEKHLQQDYQNTFTGTLQDCHNFCVGAEMDVSSTAAFVALCSWNDEDDLLFVLDIINGIKLKYK